MHGKDLPFVLLPRLYGEIVKSDIKELDGAVARRDDKLILVALRPGEVVEGILRIEPGVYLPKGKKSVPYSLFSLLSVPWRLPRFLSSVHTNPFHSIQLCSTKSLECPSSQVSLLHPNQ